MLKFEFSNFCHVAQNRGAKIMFFDRYTALCKKLGKTPTGVALELNVSRATVNYWKNGNAPKQKILLKIADYFGVTVDYLLGNEKTSANNGEGNKSTYKIFAMGGTPGVHTVTVDDEQTDKLTELIIAARDLPPEKIDMLIKMSESIK